MESPRPTPRDRGLASVALDHELYQTLRRLAHRALSGERADHTLQPTALAHEAYLELSAKDVDWGGRQHFLAAAALQMRRILVDHARAARRSKRGGGRQRVTLSHADEKGTGELELDVGELDDALTELEREDPMQARIVELCYFAGLSYDDVAKATGLSRATVGRELRFARAWLKARLERD